ncbi:recombinase family protein [Streptosporangium canum]|uniref:recombinase family protein n=1 Tax=Streptosporangium canum TaxID=324952 RepID=UPI0033A099A4
MLNEATPRNPSTLQESPVRALPRMRRKVVGTGTARGLRAAIYVRLSRETDESTSPERQLAECREYCKRHGWEIVIVEEDIDVSGFSGGLARRGLKRIMARFEEIDVVVFFKIDRLSRSLVDFAEIMKRAKANGVALASATEPLDLTDPVSEAMAKIIAIFAELEAATIGLRVASAHEHLRREGRWTGGRTPYGYRSVPNPNGPGRVLEVNPDEAKIIEEIAPRVLAKEPLIAIARDLTERGVPSPGHPSRSTGTSNRASRGKSHGWYTPTTRAVLTSPHLLGHIIEDGEVIKGTDGLPFVGRPPVMDLDTWQAVQDELARRRNPQERRRAGTALLRGVLVCVVCGNRMYSYVSNGRFRYRCIGALKNRQTAGGTPCIGPSISAKAIEDHVTKRFLEELGNVEIVEERAYAGEDYRAEIRQAEEALDELEADRYERGVFSGANGPARFAKLYEDMEGRLANLREMQANAKPGGVEPVPTGRTFGEVWAHEGTEGKRDLLLRAGAFVEVASALKSGKTVDPGRFAIWFGDEGRLRRAASGGDSGGDEDELTAVDDDITAGMVAGDD